jgi:HSP20 family protein
MDPLETIHREFDNVLNRFFGAQPEGRARWSPYAVDVREDADHVYVDAELPGFKKEEVEITLENQTLTISAERHEETKEESGKKGEYLLNERRYGRFLRSFTLPPTVDEKKVDAKLQDGMLQIVLNKREDTKPKKIAVT